MSNLEYYNKNLGRYYPLIGTGNFRFGECSVDVLKNGLADFGAILGPKVSFDFSSDKVYIYAFARTLNSLIFDVRSTADPLHRFLFEFEVNSPDYQYLEVKATTIPNYDTYFSSSSSSSVGDCDEFNLLELPDWHTVGTEEEEYGQAYMVIGRTNYLNNIIDSQKVYVGEDVDFELDTIQCLGNQFVTSIRLANSIKNRVNFEGCRPDPMANTSAWQSAVLTPEILTLREGFNCQIAIRETDNAFIISGVAGAGAGKACYPMPRTPNELNDYLNGEWPPSPDAQLCDDLIKTIENVSPNNGIILLQAGAGITILNEPDINRITINGDIDSTRGCNA